MLASHYNISFNKFCLRYSQQSAKEGQLGNCFAVAHTSASTLYVITMNNGPLKLAPPFLLLLLLTLILCRGFRGMPSRIFGITC